jgi:hypothetical protein
MKRCPRCSSDETRRSARRGIERVLSLVGVYPFRCERCAARFLRLAVSERVMSRQGTRQA